MYKIMAAGGFLLTDDWDGREEHFVDGQDLVIFNDPADLNQKIDYYLNNPDIIDKISINGHTAVKPFTRLEWAKQIINLTALR